MFIPHLPKLIFFVPICGRIISAPTGLYEISGLKFLFEHRILQETHFVGHAVPSVPDYRIKRLLHIYRKYKCSVNPIRPTRLFPLSRRDKRARFSGGELSTAGREALDRHGSGDMGEAVPPAAAGCSVYFTFTEIDVFSFYSLPQSPAAATLNKTPAAPHPSILTF